MSYIVKQIPENVENINPNLIEHFLHSPLEFPTFDIWYTHVFNHMIKEKQKSALKTSQGTTKGIRSAYNSTKTKISDKTKTFRTKMNEKTKKLRTSISDKINPNVETSKQESLKIVPDGLEIIPPGLEPISSDLEPIPTKGHRTAHKPSTILKPTLENIPKPICYADKYREEIERRVPDYWTLFFDKYLSKFYQEKYSVMIKAFKLCGPNIASYYTTAKTFENLIIFLTSDNSLQDQGNLYKIFIRAIEKKKVDNLSRILRANSGFMKLSENILTYSTFESQRVEIPEITLHGSLNTITGKFDVTPPVKIIGKRTQKDRDLCEITGHSDVSIDSRSRIFSIIIPFVPVRRED